jgi:[acyl-carrier-protein] S-malonyltransferase
MESAYTKVGEVLSKVILQKPVFPVLSNVDGIQAESADEIRRTLQDQVTGTVRWINCMERMVAMGCDLFIELGPGTVLASLLKRTNKDANVISVSDGDSARAAVAILRGA